MLGKVPFFAFRSNLQKAVGGKLTDPTYEVARMGLVRSMKGNSVELATELPGMVGGI